MNREEARRQILKFLSKRTSAVSDIQASEIQSALSGGPDAYAHPTDPLAHEVIWDLIVQRVLTVRSGGTYSWAFLSLTEFGKEVVKEQRFSPYDPDGYLKELFNEAPKLYEVCKLYAAEALNCFRTGCYIAVSVMLGAASESAVDDLVRRTAEGMKLNGKFPEVDNYEKKLAKEQSVYKRFELFKRHFDAIRTRIPKQFMEDFEGQVDGVFHLIRYYRNESGHPTQAQVERMSAFRNMVLFIPYCKRIEELGDWLVSHAQELA